VPIAPSAYSARELLAEGRGITIPVAATLRGSRGLEVAVVTAEGVEGCLTSAHAMKTGKAVRLVGNAGYDWDATRDASLKFAIQRSWERCYNLVSDAISAPAPARPGGLKIRPELRATARRVAGRRREAIGVLKLGGLGDMLQTTCVVRAAAQKYGRDVVVFCNSHPEVFRDMSEVSEVVVIPSMPQDEACRSLQREFDLFMDVRYVSCLYGDKPVAFAERHRWFYEHWTDSCGRIESLGLHATEIMLKSLDLPIEDVQPIWATPIGTRPIAEHYLALASGAGAMGRLKRWPDRYWREVAERLHTREIPLLQVGGSEDPTIPWCRDYRGLGVADTATILHHARGLIAPEGGMVHLAAAFRTPSIVIFGPTPRRAFAYPWNIALGDFQCPPCFQATPKWAEGACALGEPHCVNFPSAEDVVSLTYRMVPQ
jgi:ADP-heptose:LPS heptosyltransferase